MGHCIQAIIGPKQVLDLLQKRFGCSRVVGLNQGLFLLPMVGEFYDALPDAPDTFSWVGEFHFLFLDSKVTALLVEAAKEGAVAYVETDYFGGEGDQGAVVARDGKIVFGPVDGDGSINEALRLLGARKEAAHDEFAAVGLDRFRSNENWIEKAT